MSITITTHGGLGNQMFMYAFGLAQARRLGVELLIDNSRNTLGSFRPYNLQIFNLPEKIVGHQMPTYLEQGLEYHPEVNEDIVDGDVIHGYFQSEKYFQSVERIIGTRFAPFINGSLRPWTREQLDFLGLVLHAGDRATFVGVRRGDYLTKLDYHGIMPEAYYTEALNAVVQRTGKDPILFVFSDEPDWVEANLQFPYETHIYKNKPTIAGRIGSEDVDLLLMGRCNNAIIANSSFHWWGAWLGDNVRTGVVVAPATWFTDKHANAQDIVPSRWVKV